MFTIAIAGLGTVGAQVVRQLRDNAALITARAGRPITIKAVSGRDRTKKRDCDLSGIIWANDPQELATMPGVDAVVELMGGAEGPARHLATETLKHSRHLVTANKALLAAHAVELAQLAETAHVQMMFEAAVAGGIPVIKTLREAMAGDDVTHVRGILNGTCNYILTRMSGAGLDFMDALKEAQKLGYAEADPTADIGGHDAANKLALLSALAFGGVPNVSAIAVTGIAQLTLQDLRYADELGCTIKLLGIAERTAEGVSQRVEPVLVPRTQALAHIDGALNAVQLRGKRVGDITLQGAGAGGAPTANAVVADIIDLARGARVPAFGQPAAQLHAMAPAKSAKARYYIRLQVRDEPGVVAEITAILRDEAISIKALLQHGVAVQGVVPIVLLTHHTENAVALRAVDKMAKLSQVVERPCLLRMED